MSGGHELFRVPFLQLSASHSVILCMMILKSRGGLIYLSYLLDGGYTSNRKEKARDGRIKKKNIAIEVLNRN